MKEGEKTIAFSITSKCEQKCKYCFQKRQVDVSFDKFKEMLYSATRQNPHLTKIVITGGNPELNKDFWLMCEEVKKKGLKLKIHANYNKKETWRKFLDYADELTIPIDSLTTHFFRSEESSKNFLEAFEYFFGKVNIQVHTVASKKNLAELEDIKKFLKRKHFFDTNTWKIFRLVGKGALKKFELTDAEWAQVKVNFSGKHPASFVDNVLDY
ncbi:MAG: radical SAM protein [archaeon]|jgi:MoaA/NifB/PqqE/SkfB family radical SAM enzyme